MARSGNTAEIAKPGRAGAGRRKGGGFWFGVFFAVAAMIGMRVLLGWSESRGVLRSLGLGGGDGVRGELPAPAPTIAPAPAPAPPPATTAAPAVAPPPVAPPAAKAAAVMDAAEPIAAAPPDAHVAPAEAAPPAGGPTAHAAPSEGDEPDEEALLRTAVPNAENAVIGEGGAEEAARERSAVSKRAPARPETAILHITSAPSGAVVRTTSRVLGRTPLNIHFRTGNVYEIAFIKAGYETTTRRVAVRGTNDRKIAVSLKKRPPPRRTSFFHPHR